MKKKIITIVAIICALLVVAGALTGVYLWLESGPSYTVSDTLPNGEGRVARVVILGGQSNASGCSLDEYLKKKVSAEKYAEYENGYDNVYINYISGANVSGGFVKCATLQGELEGAFGPELGMAERFHELYPNETVFIIKCAWGGTNLYEQWLSPSSRGKTGEFYKRFVSFVDSSIKYLESKNYDVKVEGMCWMQGESDSFSEKNARNYEEHLKNFVKDVRNKFNRYASDNGIAFIDAYIADSPAYWVYGDMVNESKYTVSLASPMNVLIDTVVQGLTTSQEPAEAPDIPHYDSLSEIKLGNLFAEAVSKFFD